MARDRVIVNKEEVIDKAWDMILEEGMQAISMRKIAKELNVSPMTLYNYVENIDDIIKEIMIRGFKIINYSIDSKLKIAISNGNCKKASNVLKIIADETFDFAVIHKEIYMLIFNVDGTKFRGDPDLFPLYSSALTIIKGLFSKEYVANISKGIYTFEVFLNGIIGEKLKNRVDLSKEKFDEYIDFCLEKLLVV